MPSAEEGPFPARTQHERRHTCVSLVIAAGVNVEALQKKRGSENVSMILVFYSHLVDDH